MDNENFEIQKHDPDPFAIVGLAISAVSMFAALATVDFEKFRRPSLLQSRLENYNTEFSFEKLHSSIEKSRRDIQSLMTLLVRSNEEAMKKSFLFGETSLFLSDNQIERLQEICSQLALDISDVMRWSLQLLRIDPIFCEKIQQELIKSQHDIVGVIRGFYKNPQSNEITLETCLSLMNTFSSILDKINRDRNDPSPTLSM